jgi:uncharacterized protein
MKTIIVKPVGVACNLRCTYCFYKERDQREVRVMDDAILERMIRGALDRFERVSFNWHGGEPLLAGIDFYRRAMAIQKACGGGREIENTIQTNGTLLNGEWADFFRDHQFGVGVSLDGAQASHDANRVFPNGAGSHAVLADRIRLLERHGVTPCFMITVTPNNAGNVEADFRHFVDELGATRFAVSLMHDLGCGTHSLGNEEASAYLERLVALWEDRGDPDLSIREVDSVLGALTMGVTNQCSFNGVCERFLCVDHDGDVYPCCGFLRREGYRVGSLATATLGELCDSPRYAELIAESKRLPSACLACGWAGVCNNGCWAERDAASGLYQFCATRKFLFGHLGAMLKGQDPHPEGGQDGQDDRKG